MQTRKHTRVKDTREDHSRGALASKRYMRGPLARSTCERTLHARTTRSYSTRASRTRGSAASGTLHLGGTVELGAKIRDKPILILVLILSISASYATGPAKQDTSSQQLKSTFCAHKSYTHALLRKKIFDYRWPGLLSKMFFCQCY